MRVLKLWIFSVIELFNSGVWWLLIITFLTSGAAVTEKRDEWLESLCDSLVVKSPPPPLVNSCIQNVFFMWYFSRKFSCRVMPVCKGQEILFFPLISRFFTVGNYRSMSFPLREVFPSQPKTTEGIRESDCYLCLLLAVPCVPLNRMNSVEGSAQEFLWVLRGDGGVFPVEILVCSACCVYSLFLWEICV